MSFIELEELSNDYIFNIGSLNLLNIQDDLDKRIEKVIQKVKENDFDLVTFQEVIEADNLIQKIIENTQLKYYHQGKSVLQRGLESSNITFSRYPILDIIRHESLITPQNNINTPEIFGVVVEKNGYEILSFNIHSNWGGKIEYERIQNAKVISQIADSFMSEKDNHIVLLSGDLNAVPDADSIRGLKGLTPLDAKTGYGCYWVDSYDTGWNEDELGILTTSNPSLNYWGQRTAKIVNKDPFLTPNRRIDYIFSYGWCYGIAGYPITLSIWVRDDEEISDHLGICSKIHLP